MQELYVTGDTEHMLARVFTRRVKELGRFRLVSKKRARRMEHGIIVDFNVAEREVSVDAIQRVREQTRASVRRLFDNPSLKYIYVFCDGSVHDAVIVRQFRADFGSDICLLDLGVLYGNGVPSKVADFNADIGSSSGIIRFVDSPKSVRTTNVEVASRAIYTALFLKTCAAQTAGEERISVLAARLSKNKFQERTHFIFLDDMADIDEFQ